MCGSVLAIEMHAAAWCLSRFEESAWREMSMRAAPRVSRLCSRGFHKSVRPTSSTRSNASSRRWRSRLAVLLARRFHDDPAISGPGAAKARSPRRGTAAPQHGLYARSKSLATGADTPMSAAEQRPSRAPRIGWQKGPSRQSNEFTGGSERRSRARLGESPETAVQGGNHEHVERRRAGEATENHHRHGRLDLASRLAARER
jgi:hypothetical protein